MNPLKLLQKEIKKQGIDYYIIDTCDPHCSEYINDYYKLREYYSGFTGSNGLLLVLQDSAYLWTDGRYFVQAAKELYKGITLMKMGVKAVPTFFQFIENRLKNREVIAYNGKLFSTLKGCKLQSLAEIRGAEIRYNMTIAEQLWQMRPLDSVSKAYILDLQYTGESVSNKIKRVRKALKADKIDALFVSKLDEIMWLTNMRGSDIEYNPVFYSYLFIDKKAVYLFVNSKTVNKKCKDYLAQNNIIIKDYTLIDNQLESILKSNKYNKIASDFRYLTMNFYYLIDLYSELIDKPSPIDLFKAVKNKTEIKNSLKAYLYDSLAVTRYIKFIKEKGADGYDEYEAAAVLDNMRSKLPDFVGLSFPTISAYAGNGAMMHYEATKENAAKLQNKGLYLVDSGGQYLTGTTDVTRTVVMGEITDKCKMHYTLSVVSMLRLMNTVFIKGVTGRNLDAIARQPLWQIGSDYKCGTGHGIGYLLNVHEGPQNISYHKRPGPEAELLEGMIVSDEPGVYIEGEYGIRIETILYVKNKFSNADGDFLCFEPLTFVPVDLDGIDKKYMSDKDIDLLNAYHKLVYKKLKPFLTEEERVWLKSATASI